MATILKLFFPFWEDNKELLKDLNDYWWHRLFLVGYFIFIIIFPLLLLNNPLDIEPYSNLIKFLVYVLVLYFVYIFIQLIYINIFIFIIFGNKKKFKNKNRF
jgi:hypothetical protein